MPLTPILSKIRAITESTIRAEADQIDQQAFWPEKSIRTLQQEGLAGLVIPQESGGLGQGLFGLVQTCEIIGQESASTALCFGMHCVASAVMAAKATAQQKTDFLEPIVQGQHLTTLALSEPGTGAHFYYPQTQLLSLSEEELVVKGNKTFVTNGSRADSYVVSTVGIEPDAPFHQFILCGRRKNSCWLNLGTPMGGFRHAGKLVA